MNSDNRLITIGIADDHPLTRAGIARKLDDLDRFKVLYEAVHGQDLIDQIETAGICPDVCIMDIRMPVMDGYTATRILKEKWPETKILALSYHNEEFNVIRMLTAGASGFVPKEVAPEEFCRAVIGVYNSRYHCSELVSGRFLKQLSEGLTIDARITELHLEFLAWVCSPLEYPDIALEMKISPRQFQTLRDELFDWLGIHSRHLLVRYAMHCGITPKGDCGFE